MVDARDDFRRARRAHALSRVASWFAGGCGRRDGPRTLADPAALPQGVPRLEVIRLEAIVGTGEPTSSFDARFRPASELVRERWERVALAHRRGIALPPITVRDCLDGYYVIDGCHRVSVARVLGQRDIDAWVIETASLAASIAA